MSVQGFSTCRMQFILNDQKRSERDYSDRSLIELRQYDFGDYSLRALDIANNREEIFNFPFKEQEQYKFGNSLSQPDEVRNNNGTYRLWLNANSRNQFHEVLRQTLQQLNFLSKSPSPPPRREPDFVEKTNPLPSSRKDPDFVEKSNPRSPPRKEPDFVEKSNPRPRPRSPTDERPKSMPVEDKNELVVDVYHLGEYIRRGDIDNAVQVAKQLAGQGVRLQAKPWTEQANEKKVRIKVKIDSNNRKIANENNELTMNVYPSTTVRELRAVFEHSHHFPSSNQYFFVNGHLAHENSSMSDLDVQSNSLFILFIIQA